MTRDLVKGLITRIAVKNFVTYDEVVVKPGKHLNLIIGPNGTGKSTIVAAIVLGLGGSPKIIGRGDTISTYVKYGCKKATISIDIQHEPNKYITIERTFDEENHTTWSVNKKNVSNKQILELMKTFNIQVDNLCQFLPQDKVQEFSKLSMKHSELLFETERSVNPKLMEYHNKLKDLRTTQAEIEKELANCAKLHAKHKQEYDSLKDNVGHLQEQKKIKNKLKSLKQKKAWMQYQSKKEAFVEAKKGRDLAEKKTKELKKNLEPILQEILKLKASISNTEKAARQQNTETNARTNKLDKFLDEIENYEKSINDHETQCEEKIKQEQECDSHINQLKEQINKMENDLLHIVETVGSESQLDAQIKESNAKMSEHRRNLTDLQSQQLYIKDNCERVGRKIRDEEQKLNEILDVEEKRLQLLHKLDAPAYQGVMWLRQNKHLFSHPIHEPMLLSINLKDPKYSLYFENIISHRDLVAFVCEDKADMNLLLNYLRDQKKLKVNALHSDPNRFVDYTPPIPLESIKQYGFEHYLVSLIEAPTVVLNYLVSQYGINQIAIGNDKVASNIDSIPLRCFFSTTHLFRVNVSKYTKEKSTSQQAISSRGNLAITVDQESINSIQEEILKLKNEKNELQNKLASYMGSLEALNAKIDSQKEVKNKLQRSKDSIDQLRAKMGVNTRKINDAERNRRSVDEIRAYYKKEIETAIANQLKQYEKYNKLLDDCCKNIIMNEEIKLQIKLKKNQLAVKENDSQDLREELTNSERNLRALNDEIEPLKAELKKQYDEARTLTGGFCQSDKEWEQYKIAFAKLPPTEEKLNAEIQTYNAKIFSVGNDTQEAEKTIERFKHAKKQVDKFEGIMAEKGAELEKVSEDINRIKNEWFPKLEELVEKINSNFSNYFKKMKCAGEVSLSLPENQNDFDKYGMKIRVKFRDADELQELTRNHQSGGERAVTTAVYMMSLQELTIVPFRCVDEINQGMDATNERRVFDLIVDITSKATSSQYFMLTPKLLPDLKYNDSITVLTVFNGKYMLPCSEFDLQSQCDDIVKAAVMRRTSTAMVH